MGETYLKCALCRAAAHYAVMSSVQWTEESYQRVLVCNKHELNQEVLVLG